MIGGNLGTGNPLLFSAYYTVYEVIPQNSYLVFEDN